MAQISDIENGIRLKDSQRIVIRPVMMNKTALVFRCPYGRRKMIHAKLEVAFMKIRSEVNQTLNQAAIIASKSEGCEFRTQINGDERHHLALRTNFSCINNVSLELFHRAWLGIKYT